MFSKTKNLILCTMILALATSVAVAQESKDNDEPAGSGQAPNAEFGPDAFGYAGSDSDEAQCSFDFIDISATGTLVVQGDDVGAAVALGGSGFEFYGEALTTLFASTNGYLSTDSADGGGDLSNDCPLPEAPSSGGGARLYPLHDDLEADDPNGALFHEYFADCPRPGVLTGEGCNIFQWDNANHFPDTEVNFTFQAILYEASGAIIFQHGPGNPEAGAGSTTGIQNAAATDGLTYACDTAASVNSDTAQCIYHPDFQPFGIEGASGFVVNKTFDDGNPGEVEVTISCNTGLPLEQSDTISEGDNVTFVVTDFEDGAMDCSITETAGSEGYLVEYTASGVTSDVSCEFTDVAVGLRHVCNVSNTLEAVEVVVTKEWIDENPQFNNVNYAEATYSCVNEQFVETFGGLEFIGNGDTDAFDVFPHWDGTTTCSVTESVVEGGVEADSSDCQALSVTPGNGAACTIVNTRLYEGIPTLSQYGLGLLALLMLGMGFVAVRRFV